MRQDVDGQVGHVDRQDVVATPEDSQGPGPLHQAEAAARRGPVGQQRRQLRQPPAARLPGGHDQAHGVLRDRVVDEHAVDGGLQLDQLLEREHLLGVRSGDAHPADDLHLLGHGRVADLDLHQEAVPLRLGQGVDALGLDRVLRRQHQERRRERVGRAAEAHLPLGHDLEQRRLHLGRRAVDLVDQHEVGEDGAELDVEGLARGAVDAGAQDVARHQVGGELQAYRGAADDGRERLDRERLGDPGHALEQAVPACEQGHGHPLHHAVLAHDHLLDLEQRALEHRPRGSDVAGRRSSRPARRARHVVPSRRPPAPERTAVRGPACPVGREGGVNAGYGQSREPALSTYIAASARRQVWRSDSPGEQVATPTAAARAVSPTVPARVMASRTLCTTCSAAGSATPGMSRPNSSPPRRATVSPRRATDRRASAPRVRKRSPAS